MLEVMAKKDAIDLLTRAAENVKTTGTVDSNLIVHKRKRIDGQYVCEVGTRKAVTSNVPANQRLIIVKFNDELVKAIDNYNNAVSAVC